RRVKDQAIGEFDIPGLPVKFSRWADRSEIAADPLGEHNEEVLRELLSLADQEIANLYADEVLVRDPLLHTSTGHPYPPNERRPNATKRALRPKAELASLRIVAASRVAGRRPDHDPKHHVPGVANSREKQRDLRGGEQVEARFRLPQQQERGDQEKQIAQQRDRRVEQPIDDVHLEAALDEELNP